MKYYYRDKVTCTIGPLNWNLPYSVEVRVYRSYMGVLEFLFPNRPSEDYTEINVSEADVYTMPVYNTEDKELMWVVSSMCSHTHEDLFEAITRINGLCRGPKYKVWLASDKEQYELWYNALTESERFEIYCHGEYSPRRLD